MLDPERVSGRYHRTGKLSRRTIASFQTLILAHYHAEQRRMPWRETRDPYAILVSEIMLQQTQVERVIGKYSDFLAAFPTVRALADAPLPAVLQLWQGLGYNRRALALKRCAEEVVNRYAGQLPCTAAELQTLPGIGPYTASAVAVFAFDAAEALIETNIRSVFIHFFFHGHDKVDDRAIMPLVAVTLDRESPREWFYALMDFGVWLKQLFPNPGRRSRHHVRQSPFEGSNRQLRSRLLREIMAAEGVSAAQLADHLGADLAQVEMNLANLEREHFIERSNISYTVRNDKKEG